MVTDILKVLWYMQDCHCNPYSANNTSNTSPSIVAQDTKYILGNSINNGWAYHNNPQWKYHVQPNMCYQIRYKNTGN